MSARTASSSLFSAVLLAAPTVVAAHPHVAAPPMPLPVRASQPVIPPMHAPLRAPVHPTTVVHHFVPPARPVTHFVVVPVYVTPWQVGWAPYGGFGAFGGLGAFGSLGMNSALCSAQSSSTLGELGGSGGGGWFAPVALGANPQTFDVLPSSATPLSPSSVCTAPSGNLTTLSIGL